MPYKIVPLGDRVLCKRRVEAEETTGGIIIPESSRLQKELADVIFVSDVVRKRSPHLKEGSLVLIGKYTGTEVTVEEEKFLLIREEDIIGIIQEVK